MKETRVGADFKYPYRLFGYENMQEKLPGYSVRISG
jgi:hypothetical protein